MVENRRDAPFHMWGQNSNAYNLYIIGKEVLSGYCIVFITRIQKCTYFELLLLIENQRDIFLKVVGFLLKIIKIRKNDLKKSQ